MLVSELYMTQCVTEFLPLKDGPECPLCWDNFKHSPLIILNVYSIEQKNTYLSCLLTVTETNYVLVVGPDTEIHYLKRECILMDLIFFSTV